jgi:hypothetical protein
MKTKTKQRSSWQRTDIITLLLIARRNFPRYFEVDLESSAAFKKYLFLPQFIAETLKKFYRILISKHRINLFAPELFFNFSTPCMLNVNNTGTKYVRIMKQAAF